MVDIIVNSPAEAVVSAVRRAYGGGGMAEPRGQRTWELLNASILIREPWRIPFEIAGRGLNNKIGAVEAVQLVAGEPMLERVREIKSLAKLTVDDTGVSHGNYGQRVYGQLGRIVDELNGDPGSRQAVMTIFDTNRDLVPGAKPLDVPCTLAVQFFVRGYALHARTTMRSNDVWLGLPYDLIQFIALQGAVAAAIGLPVGTYYHSVGSLHLYERDVEPAKFMLSTKQPAFDPLEGPTSRRLWSGTTAREIVETARSLGAGDMTIIKPGSTAFEQWLAVTLS